MRELRASADAGACGIKVWKDLGLAIRDEHGERLLPDDERLSDVWDAAGELGLPIVIHIADPVAFFEPRGCAQRTARRSCSPIRSGRSPILGSRGSSG